MAERYFTLPEEYEAPSYEKIVGGITETGIRFRGESAPWGIATEPTVLPEALGAELAELGPTLQNAFHLERVALTGGGKFAQQAEQFVRFSIPDYIPTDPRYLDKKPLRLMRPDIVITSERTIPKGSWWISGGIAEVETRPAGTFMYPALLEGYGISRAEYMRKWVEAFGDRPWVALYPEEWKLYVEELEAFSDDLKKHGGRSLGVHNLDRMTSADADRIPEDANAYLFGYLDVWARSGSLPLAQAIAQRDRTVVFNPLHYHLETKASLVLFQQPWFLDELAKRYGDEHAQRLQRWMIEGYVLNVEAPQDMNTGQMITDRNQWVLKRAGFSPDATESKGVIMPGDHKHRQVFTDTLRAGLSGNDGQWIAQRFQRSRVPQTYYHPDTGKPDWFEGSMRISPLYLSINRRQVDMLGVMSTVSYGSERAHGGSGKEVKPGMAVMAPVAFGETYAVEYSSAR